MLGGAIAMVLLEQAIVIGLSKARRLSSAEAIDRMIHPQAVTRAGLVAIASEDRTTGS